MVAGCFFKPSPPNPEEQAEKIIESISAGGYTAEHTYTIKTIRDRWLHDGQPVEILVLAPVNPGNYPVLLYLPGLGERADGGAIWRENWAKAGYFVVSIQTEEMGNAVKEIAPVPFGPPEKPDDDSGFFGEKKSDESDALRTSELRYLGRQYASLENLTKCMNHIVWAYDQVRQKVMGRQDTYRTADLSRVVVAGYEFGAQTVSAMIGEQFDKELPKPDNFKPIAAIMVSPLVDLSLGKLATRYQKITIPVLSITSREDTDPYAISTPEGFWENCPPDNKYQLTLKYANHQLLSGSHWSSGDMPPDGDMPNMPGEIPGFNGLNSGGGPGAGDPPMMGGMPSSSGMANGKQDAKQLAAVISVSTAFLDSFVKSDKFATAWLHNSVHKWLKKSGTLQSK